MSYGKRQVIADLHRAARKGDKETLLTLLEMGICDDISPDARGRTLLHTACERAEINMMFSLLSCEVPIDVKDRDGNTPLMKAAENGHFSTVRELLEAEANPNITNKLGETAMHLAAKIGDAMIMEILAENGADLHACNKIGLTTLHYGCMTDRIESVLYLLNHNADINKRDANGNTALQFAIKAEARCTIILLAWGADTSLINLKDKRLLKLMDDFRNSNCTLTEANAFNKIYKTQVLKKLERFLENNEN